MGLRREAEDAGLLLLGAQEDGGEGRRERERVEGGDRDGEGDGERELLVENAGGAGEEADRNEDGDEHERGRDDGAGDLGHGVRWLCGDRRRSSPCPTWRFGVCRTSGA